MITTEDNMRRLLILFLLFSAAFVGARERSALVVRSFPFTHSGYLDVNHGGAATMWIDFSQDPSGATITTSDGGYTLTKAGAPARVNDGTWPAGLSGAQGYAHDLNGVGSFSVRCALTAHDVSGSQDIIGKWTALGSQRGWKLYLSTTTVGLGVSDDGTTDAGHVSYASKAAAVSKFVPAFITASYQYVADGSSVGNVYVNNLSTGSNSSMDGPAFDNTSNFEIGSGSGNFFNGLIHHCAYYDGVVLTEADHDFAFAQWQGRMSTTGNVATVTSAAPPDVIMAPPASGTCDHGTAGERHRAVHRSAAGECLVHRQPGRWVRRRVWRKWHNEPGLQIANLLDADGRKRATRLGKRRNGRRRVGRHFVFHRLRGEWSIQCENGSDGNDFVRFDSNSMHHDRHRQRHLSQRVSDVRERNMHVTATRA